MPTYKRNKYENVWINKNEQCPSYTDRILVKNNVNCNKVELVEYNALENYKGSDHRPVFLRLNMKIMPKNLL